MSTPAGREPLKHAVAAIRTGDVDALKRLLGENPGLATTTTDDSAASATAISRTLLHVATDWPGHFPNIAQSIAALVDAGADVDARCTGAHAETPLHWAASSDDIAALDALLHARANIEAAGAVIGGGTPLANAVAFGQWKAARRLVERGARTTLWQAAALGLLERVQNHFLSGRPPDASITPAPRPGHAPPDEVTHAFWCACHGGQQSTAEYLLRRGANLNWLGYDNLTPLGAAVRSGATELAAWLRTLGAT